jgi:hypothetical protein
MNKYMHGMKHTTQSAKQHFSLKLTEGKQQLPIKVNE